MDENLRSCIDLTLTDARVDLAEALKVTRKRDIDGEALRKALASVRESLAMADVYAAQI